MKYKLFEINYYEFSPKTGVEKRKKEPTQPFKVENYQKNKEL